MNVLVTGANGFAGRWLLRHLHREGHRVVAAAGADAAGAVRGEELAGVTWTELDLLDPVSIATCADLGAEAVVHLAGIASVPESLRDPGRAWAVNALGTARLLEALGQRRRAGLADPVVLVVSTAEVYGSAEGRAPRREEDPVAPRSPYAASKAAAELAALEVWRRTGLRVVIARAFPHTGPGQSTRFVVPAFAERVALARRTSAPTAKTGNLEPVRDLLDVRDVVEAYALLLTGATPGEVYNVASGIGLSLEQVFHRLAALAGHPVLPEPEASLIRAVDILHLVGDAAKLREQTGWRPRTPLDHTLRDLLDAQAL